MRTRPIAAAGTRAAPARRHRPPRRREQPLGRYPGSRAGRRAWGLLGGAYARTSRPRRLPAAQLATVASVTARLAYRCGGSAGITRHRPQHCGCAHRHRRWTGFPFNPATAWRLPAAGAPIGKPEYSDVSLPCAATARADADQAQRPRRPQAGRRLHRPDAAGQWMPRAGRRRRIQCSGKSAAADCNLPAGPRRVNGVQSVG